jgi:ribosomal protein S18 acetylase RimI-like enzyme
MALIHSNVRIAIRSVTPKDQPRLANLLHFEFHVHRHLDWISPLELIGEQPFLVVEQDQQVQAALACPVDPPGVAWLRMFAASRVVSYEAMWQLLWGQVRQELKEDNNRIVAFSLRDWFGDMLERSRFRKIQDVVFLTRDGYSSIKPAHNVSMNIRLMEAEDLPAVEQVDMQAFGPIWRNSFSSLKAALSQSYISTVAETNTGIIGYQISTAGHMGGHLARLAVLPELQGKKVGHDILVDLLNQFAEHSINRISVNTQHDNQASLRLYKRLGFYLTGETYPVLEYFA